MRVELSKIIDLDRFVGRDEVDPLYLDAPYYVYPEGELAAETFRVIGEAMAHTNKVGLGRITMSGRERPVLVEPRGEGLMMSQLRSSDEVRPAEFASKPEAQIDPDLVALAETIIERKSGKFEPAGFHDRYQEALRELVDSKLKGEAAAASPAIEEPPKVVNLMDALKRSLAREEARRRAGAALRRPGARGRPATGASRRCCCRCRAGAMRNPRPRPSRQPRRRRSAAKPAPRPPPNPPRPPSAAARPEVGRAGRGRGRGRGRTLLRCCDDRRLRTPPIQVSWISAMTNTFDAFRRAPVDCLCP